MAADSVEDTFELPSAYGPEATIRFFPEYSTKHPLWFWFGYPDLADLRLPADLTDRLHRWSAYWDSTFLWDDGWPIGTPAIWWTEEEADLPRDVATAFGSDFVVEVGDRYLHSTTGPASPTLAAALHSLIRAESNEREQIRADIAARGSYDAVAGGTSYTTWLADRQQEKPPSR